MGLQTGFKVCMLCLIRTKGMGPWGNQMEIWLVLLSVDPAAVFISPLFLWTIFVQASEYKIGTFICCRHHRHLSLIKKEVKMQSEQYRSSGWWDQAISPVAGELNGICYHKCHCRNLYNQRIKQEKNVLFFSIAKYQRYWPCNTEDYNTDDSNLDSSNHSCY